MAIFIPLVAVAVPLGWYTYTTYTQDSRALETPVEEYETMVVALPARALAKGAVAIHPRLNVQHFTQWNVPQIETSYDLLQRIVQVWKAQGIHNYMIFGKENVESSDSSFTWEAVPYPQEGWRFWKQLKVLWNVAFGGAVQPKEEREQEARALQTALALSEVKQNLASAPRGTDPFCDPKVIERQKIFEGKTINVLYNHAPIPLGERQLHFLITPKEHRAGFSDLSKEEYTEAMRLSQRIARFYQERGYPIVYLYDKTGTEAGQTVPHWHEHLIFTTTKTQALFGKFLVLKNMVLRSGPLSEEELQPRISALKEELKNLN